MSNELRSEAEIEAELEGLEAPFAPGKRQTQETEETEEAEVEPAEEAPAASRAPEPSEAELRRLDEVEASRKGWVPKNKYSGNPDQWVDATTFLERGRNFNKNLQKEIENLRAAQAKLEADSKAFKEFSAKQLKAKEDELAATVTELRKLKVGALREGDDDEVIRIEDAIDTAKAEQAALKAQQAAEVEAAKAPKIDPELTAWIADGNEWFDTDPVLRAAALEIGNELLRKGETARGTAFLKKVETIVRDDFSARFKSSRPRSNVEAGRGSGGRSTASKSEESLPAADRALMESLVEDGLTTKEKFLASYFSRN